MEYARGIASNSLFFMRNTSEHEKRELNFVMKMLNEE